MYIVSYDKMFGCYFFNHHRDVCDNLIGVIADAEKDFAIIDYVFEHGYRKGRFRDLYRQVRDMKKGDSLRVYFATITKE